MGESSTTKTQPSSYPLTRFDSCLSPSNINDVDTKGYTIVDGFLGEEWSYNLRNECTKLQANKELSQHYFTFGKILFEKPNIFEADLFDASVREKSSELSFLFNDASPYFTSQLKKLLPDLHLETNPNNNNGISVKLQYNKGSLGCFPYHYDNTGRPSKRQLTCVVYLNPAWREGDGGELELWPFLGNAIKIPPLMDRAVLFRSDLILHRVLPSQVERYCFTIWIDGKRVNEDKDTLLTKDKLQFRSYDEASGFFQQSPLQRCISRAVYNSEYEKSLLECVKGTKGEATMLRHHRANVSALEVKLRPLIEEFRLRKKDYINDE